MADLQAILKKHSVSYETANCFGSCYWASEISCIGQPGNQNSCFAAAEEITVSDENKLQKSESASTVYERQGCLSISTVYIMYLVFRCSVKKKDMLLLQNTTWTQAKKLSSNN